VGPLDGIRVLDLTRFQQGPYATVMLADLGAEIWKIEARGTGDPGRQVDVMPDGFGRYFEAYDRGKRSITLDTRTDAGSDVALRLAEQVDVVVDNFRPGVMDRLGLGDEALRARNAGIIIASASAFGADGPLAGRPGYDVIGQAMGGVMTLQAPDGEAEPVTMPGGFADQIGAMQLCVGVLSALLARERTGVGQRVDVSLLGSQIALQSVYLTGFLHNQEQPFSRRRRTPTFTFYQAADGRWLVIGVIDQRNWRALCTLLSLEELVEDARFVGPRERVQNSAALELILEEQFARRSRPEWLEALAAADIPNAPVNDYADITSEAQAWENGYFTEIEHPRHGAIKIPGVPWRFSETEAAASGAAPELGADTDAILREAGFSQGEIDGLRLADVI
jgi:CoA:oxalate CoA-transferase